MRKIYLKTDKIEYDSDNRNGIEELGLGEGERMNMADKQGIKNIFNQWEDLQNFSGVISVSDKNGVIYEKVQGFRNRGEQLPNEMDTAFMIASGTKLFTSFAICQLIDQGKLSLDSRIGDILPHELKKIDKDVTIFHLLTHTSGIWDYFEAIEKISGLNDRSIFDRYPVHKWINLEFYLALFNELPNKIKPGSEAEYSNSNFILLGLVIETISQKSYRDYVKEHIIEPLNLRRTGFYPTNNLPSNTAIGYVEDEVTKEIVANTFIIPIIGSPDGGLYTCTQDMEILWKAVFSHQLFSENMLEKMVVPYSEEDYHRFGLGVMIDEKEKGTIYYHSGADEGVRFISMYSPETESIATIIGNTDLNIFDLVGGLMSLLTVCST